MDDKTLQYMKERVTKGEVLKARIDECQMNLERLRKSGVIRIQGRNKDGNLVTMFGASSAMVDNHVYDIMFDDIEKHVEEYILDMQMRFDEL